MWSRLLVYFAIFEVFPLLGENYIRMKPPLSNQEALSHHPAQLRRAPYLDTPQRHGIDRGDLPNDIGGKSPVFSRGLGGHWMSQN